MLFQGVATRHPSLGVKRLCVACGTRFYDMARTPAVCPKCEAPQPPDVPRVAAPRRVADVRRFGRAAPRPAAEAEEPAEAVEAVAADTEDEDEEEEGETDDPDDKGDVDDDLKPDEHSPD
jgi:uncharacterized protein (TIGR02300 family)